MDSPCMIGVKRSWILISPQIVIPSRALSCLSTRPGKRQANGEKRGKTLHTPQCVADAAGDLGAAQGPQSKFSAEFWAILGHFLSQK